MTSNREIKTVEAMHGCGTVTADIVFSEPIYWTRGFPEIKVFDTDFARIGVHICGDLYTGEIDRVLALKGAEIIFDPSQMWGADGYNNEMLLRAPEQSITAAGLPALTGTVPIRDYGV